MATVSFNKNIVINEPKAVSKLIDALANDKSRKVDKQFASPSEIARGEQKLKQYLSLRGNHCGSNAPNRRRKFIESSNNSAEIITKCSG